MYALVLSSVDFSLLLLDYRRPEIYVSFLKPTVTAKWQLLLAQLVAHLRVNIKRKTECLVKGRVVEITWHKRPEPILVIYRPLVALEKLYSVGVCVAGGDK